MTITMRPARRYIDGLVSGKTAFVRVPLDAAVEENDEFGFSFEPEYSGRIKARAGKIQKVRLSDMTKQEVLEEGFDAPEFCYLGKTCGSAAEAGTFDKDPALAGTRARENLEALCRIHCVMHETYQRMFMRHFGQTFLDRKFEDEPDDIQHLMVKKVRFTVLENTLQLIKKPEIHLQ